jgi:hypothetical protein
MPPPILQARIERLQRVRANPVLLPALKAYYAEHPAAFIAEWGSTLDPRNVERDLPSFIRFCCSPSKLSAPIGSLSGGGPRRTGCL